MRGRITAGLIVLVLGAGSWAMAEHAPLTARGRPATDLVDKASVMTYQARVLDDAGIGVDGSFDVEVRMFDTSQSAEAEVYRQSFPGHAIEDGLLSVGLEPTGFEFPALGAGTADAAAADILARLEALELEVEVGGSVLGGRQPLRATAYAAHASAASAQSVAYGGDHGLVRADLVAENLRIAEGVYWVRDIVPSVAEPGWGCKKIATVLSPGPACELDEARLHARNRYVAHVGCGTVSLDTFLEITFPDGGGDILPPDACSRVYAAHAVDECVPSPSDVWTPDCWNVEFIPAPTTPDAAMPVRVTQICWDPSGGQP